MSVTQTTTSAADTSLNPTTDDFAALLDEALGSDDLKEGSVVRGRIVSIEKDMALIDVGLKTEGRVPLKEFEIAEQEVKLDVGSEVEVYLERVENALGEAVPVA